VLDVLPPGDNDCDGDKPPAPPTRAGAVEIGLAPVPAGMIGPIMLPPLHEDTRLLSPAKRLRPGAYSGRAKTLLFLLS